MRRRIVTALLLTGLVLGLQVSPPVHAAQTEVVFKNVQTQAVIELSSDDLFDNFKGVMPGQTLTQQILLRNETGRSLRVYIKGKALGAAEKAFLQVASLEGSVNGRLIFDYKTPVSDLSREATLAVLPANASSVLQVVLSAPAGLGNEYQNASLSYAWVLRAVDELVGGDQDQPPRTGADLRYLLLPTLLVFLSFFLFFILWKRRRKEES